MRSSFLLKEVRRFFRSSPLLSVSAFLVLSLSLAVCLLALTMKSALSSMAYPGMRSLAYATVAEQTDGGGSMPIPWDTLERVHTAVQQKGIGLAAYSKPIAATLQTSPGGQPIRGNLAAISGGFFGAYTGPLLAGRGFTPEEIEQPQSGRRAVILVSLRERQGSKNCRSGGTGRPVPPRADGARSSFGVVPPALSTGTAAQVTHDRTVARLSIAHTRQVTP